MSGRPVSIACLCLLVLGLAACRPPPASSADASPGAASAASDQFLSLMNRGKNYLDQGDATNALAVYRKADALVPNHPDVHLNLAAANLLAGDAAEAIREAETVLRLSPNSAAAYFVIGSAHLRLGQPADAAKALQNVQKLDPGDTATCFQLGKAWMDLKQWDEAAAAFRMGIALDPNHLHTAAHYLLGQALRRAGRDEEARRELEQHVASLEVGGPAVNVASFERSKYTAARVPFRLDQPDPAGVPVRYVDATRQTLGDAAPAYSGPVGVIDVHHTGWNSLFVLEGSQHFRLLWNSNGTFQPTGPAYPVIPGTHYVSMLVGDLQNDRYEDVVVLGDQGSHLFKFGTNGLATDLGSSSRLAALGAIDGALVDLDFTGKLDLVAVTAASNQVRLLRQFGPLYFGDITSTSGIPASLRDARAVTIDDWNGDGLMDLVVTREAGPPLVLEKRRGAELVTSPSPPEIAGAVGCSGDFDNDLRSDFAVLSGGKLTIAFNGGTRREMVATGPYQCTRIEAIDYDNDGWLDLWAWGEGIRVWRNLGLAGFQERTRELGLETLNLGAVSACQFADFDQDCDPDVVVALAGGGLRYLRNDGGNANSQVKVRLVGNRSNASGLGCRVEVEAGGVRLVRTIRQLPVEVGVGRHQVLDSFLVHWLNWPQGGAEVPFSCTEPLLALELTLQEGSCPYLYAWDGAGFRFVTDILGAAPLGLPVAAGRYTDANPEELVWIGDERSFSTRDGHYQVRITEELREVLYLDEAKLVVVDHPPGVEVHSTDRLLPTGPFLPGALVTLANEHPLQKAVTFEGRDVTAALARVDGRRVSPPRLRGPQLRGLAEPNGVILDFGPLEANRPWVLVLNGWLRFGGGMANIAASHDPALPFPFPVLEAETAPGTWCAVDVTIGAPAGKTKTIAVDLAGKLPAGTRRLRLTQAFEIHWDRIALMERSALPRTRITRISPTAADLQFRGFSALQELPPDCPPSPDYDRVSVDPYWTLIPGGWCTRYGDVTELVIRRDEGLVLANAGDELSLMFAAGALPPKPAEMVREFFLYLDGWDKDSDFHVAAGTTVEPLPFHGMDSARYGREPRPAFPSDALHRRYNTRWVEGTVLKRIARH